MSITIGSTGSTGNTPFTIAQGTQLPLVTNVGGGTPTQSIVVPIVPQGDGFGGAAPSVIPSAGPHVPMATVALGTETPVAQVQQAVMPAQNFYLNPPGWTPPTDFNHQLPPEVRSRYGIFAATPPTNGGEFNSRHEVEMKLGLPVDQVDPFRTKLEELFKDPKKVKEIFGEGWEMHRADRYFESKTGADGKAELKLDAKGLPIARVMSDVLYDDDKLSLTKSGSVLRFREFEGDKFNMVNFKPGFGNWVGNIISRIEYALLVGPGIKEDPTQLSPFLESNEHFNPGRFAKAFAPGVDFNQLKPRFENSDTRYRYILEHKGSLTEIEISLDHVTGRARGVVGADGKMKEVQFAQFEMESMHTNIVGESWDLSNPAQAQSYREQAAAARASGVLTDNGQPQIHLPADADNKAIRNTDSYKIFVGATDAMTKFMYGSTVPVVHGDQKGHQIATMLGMVSGTV